MKIAIVCGRDIERARDTDGGSILIRNLAHELRRQGHGITIYTPSHASYGGSEQYFLDRIAISQRWGAYFDDGKLHKYDRVYIFHVANTFGLFEGNRCPLSRTVLFPMLLGAFYRLFQSVPPEYIRAEKEALKAAHYIATPSAAEQDVLRDFYHVPKEKIFITRRGYDPSIFKPLLRTHIPKDRLDIVCANALKPQKDQRFFVDLVATAREYIPEIVIHLAGIGEMNGNAGYGNYARALKREVAERGLTPHFIFHELLSQSAVNRLMQECHLAFYPSRTETFGKSVLESVVTGLPTIVLNDVPAYDEFLEHAYTCIKITRSATAAFEAIETLRTDPKRYRALSENGIAIAPRFTWERVVADFLHDSEARIGS
ncbi:MAG: glycosyltransferase family 4 protein [Candidatus Paceibacterota bacterium]